VFGEVLVMVFLEEDDVSGVLPVGFLECITGPTVLI